LFPALTLGVLTHTPYSSTTLVSSAVGKLSGTGTVTSPVARALMSKEVGDEVQVDIGVREAYKRVLVQDIYRAQNLERIVEAGTCACNLRFPTWKAAETFFLERFATAERWEMLEASDTFNRHANALRPEAMAICEAEGNW